jgi:hypothetical protein
MSATNCRACGKQDVSLVLDLGLMPPSRRFLTPETACLPEPIHPLRLLRCEGCGLLQLEATDWSEENPAESFLGSEDPHAVLHDLAQSLSPTDSAVLELPDLQFLHDGLACDLICHETQCYFSLGQINELFRADRLELVDVAASAAQPGMLQLTVQRKGGPLRPSPAVDIALARERGVELDRPQAWADFGHLVELGRDLLCSELAEWLYRNRKIAAYSVGGYGMTTLAYCGGPAHRLPCLIDECAELHGLLTPGHRLPIVGPERLVQEHFDVVLLLGRDFDPVGDGPLHDFWCSGGRVLMPSPKPHYVDAPQPVLLHGAPGLSFADFG